MDDFLYNQKTLLKTLKTLNYPQLNVLTEHDMYASTLQRFHLLVWLTNRIDPALNFPKHDSNEQNYIDECLPILCFHWAKYCFTSSKQSLRLSIKGITHDCNFEQNHIQLKQIPQAVLPFRFIHEVVDLCALESHFSSERADNTTPSSHENDKKFQDLCQRTDFLLNQAVMKSASTISNHNIRSHKLIPSQNPTVSNISAKGTEVYHHRPLQASAPQEAFPKSLGHSSTLSKNSFVSSPLESLHSYPSSDAKSFRTTTSMTTNVNPIMIVQDEISAGVCSSVTHSSPPSHFLVKTSSHFAGSDENSTSENEVNILECSQTLAQIESQQIQNHDKRLSGQSVRQNSSFSSSYLPDEMKPKAYYHESFNTKKLSSILDHLQKYEESIVKLNVLTQELSSSIKVGDDHSNDCKNESQWPHKLGKASGRALLLEQRINEHHEALKKLKFLWERNENVAGCLHKTVTSDIIMSEQIAHEIELSIEQS